MLRQVSYTRPVRRYPYLIASPPRGVPQTADFGAALHQPRSTPASPEWDDGRDTLRQVRPVRVSGTQIQLRSHPFRPPGTRPGRPVEVAIVGASEIGRASCRER